MRSKLQQHLEPGTLNNASLIRNDKATATLQKGAFLPRPTYLKNPQSLNMDRTLDEIVSERQVSSLCSASPRPSFSSSQANNPHSEAVAVADPVDLVDVVVVAEMIASVMIILETA